MDSCTAQATIVGAANSLILFVVYKHQITTWNLCATNGMQICKITCKAISDGMDKHLPFISVVFNYPYSDCKLFVQ